MKQIRLKESKNGSKLLLETLASLGIDTIFGYPGGAVLPLYDAIYNFDVFAIFWHVMSKEPSTKQKDMLNQQENLGLPL